MLDKYNIFSNIYTFKSQGYKRLRNGTELIGYQVKQFEPIEWLHYICSPLNSNEISTLENKVGRIFPTAYKEILYTFNGLCFFGDNFVIFGKNEISKGMSWEEQIFQPIDLELELQEVPDLPLEWLYFGKSKDSLYLMDNIGKVIEVDYHGNITKEWKNKSAFFERCIAELTIKFSI